MREISVNIINISQLTVGNSLVCRFLVNNGHFLVSVGDFLCCHQTHNIYNGCFMCLITREKISNWNLKGD